jgi:D-alanyl-D-alanine carboxypeptidase/D-alanyl-D-alanine-endopeptidase (penicillin-binding protein 4)
LFPFLAAGALTATALLGACGSVRPARPTLQPSPVDHGAAVVAGGANSPAGEPGAGGAPAGAASGLSAPVPATPLTAALDATLFNTNSCLLVTDAGTGEVVYDHRGDVPLAPASTQKLLVTVAALARLGPDYRFTTTVAADGAGAVWLIGGGDPLLASPEYAAYRRSNPVTAGDPTTPLTALADQLVARGVAVRAVHGDDSRYEAVRYLPTWTSKLNQGEFDIGPLSALEVDQGLDRFRPDVATEDPTGHAAGVLARLLRDRHVGASQGADGRVPAGTPVVASVASPPLSDILGAMLRASDNQIAELLVRELDRQAGGSGTTAGGVRVVMAEAAAAGVPTGGVSLIDGSGLSQGNRATCRALLGALNAGDNPRFSALTAGLPVAGVSGNLMHLFAHSPMEGHLAAKGGYITGVSALVGRLEAGRRLRFAFVVNGSFDYATGLGLTVRVVNTLAAGGPTAG